MRCSHCGQGDIKSPSINCHHCSPVKEEKWRHMKTGKLYTVIGKANIQAAALLTDMDEVVVYRAADGRLWVRPTPEFHERFDKQ